ncbi:GNAT family N-acetyltransferase [Fredinandcohnia sp. FSL W7-1320]|uniref:GNAT family N-acetyltransferase n=1 Tax=Fredinandcohnia sp. FSL W7-1320 TaxID=2954540 RepID=UPI0030FD9DF0
MKQIRTATEQDIEKVRAFLVQAEVSAEGIESIIDHFILLEDAEQQILATLGIERIEKDGLLRSLVISPGVDQTNLLTLFKSAISLAKHKEISRLYLATNKQASIQFFTMLGFGQVETNELPVHIIGSNHISQLLEKADPMFMVSQIEK